MKTLRDLESRLHACTSVDEMDSIIKALILISPRDGISNLLYTIRGTDKDENERLGKLFAKWLDSSFPGAGK